MTDPIRYLFVYGTLMSGATSAFGRAQRLRLAAESDSLGPASIPHARLFDLGRYPGATIDGTLDDIVQGEAVLLNNPRSALKWLDAYEGVTSGKEETNEYARVVREVEERDLSQSTVVVFRVVGRGTATIAFALTRGDTSSKALKAIVYRVTAN